MARGDHLFYYVARTLYSHHGICCGDGTVIHYESSPWMKFCGTRANGAVPSIQRVTYDEFRLGNLVSRREYPACDVADVVIERAESRLGESCYSLIGNNCEHFAIWCKTGASYSTQVAAHLEATRTVVSNIGVGATLLRAARRVPGPYRGWAYAAAFAAAGTVYLGTYVAERRRDMLNRVS